MKWNSTVYDEIVAVIYGISLFKVIWSLIAVIMFIIALFTQREVFALLALVAAMMRKD